MMGFGARRGPLRAALATTIAVSLAGSCAGVALAQSRSAAAPPKGVPVPHEVTSRVLPLKAARSELVEFNIAPPFPYAGKAPSGRPFLDVTDEDGRRGHRTSRGGVLWEDVSFSDRRALLYIPKGFDARRPGLIVVFLHGHRATLERDVRDRQRVADQIALANVNAVLVAPQFAVNASDSSAGRFWESYGFASFLGEAGSHLARLHGDWRTRKTFATLPVVVIAYSGGYVPAAWALHKGGTSTRVIGVLMLDALYGEAYKYADWIERHPNAFFVSSYTSSSAGGNHALLSLLAERDIAVAGSLPARLNGGVVFLPTGASVSHESFVTQAWADNPIKDVLERIPGYARTPARRIESSSRDPLGDLIRASP
jgi:hypothetical protein